jgi:hypothetical protein
VIVDRRGRNILSVRDQTTFDSSLRKKRLMTLNHLFLVHRYKIWAPTIRRAQDSSPGYPRMDRRATGRPERTGIRQTAIPRPHPHVRVPAGCIKNPEPEAVPHRVPRGWLTWT